MVINLKKIRKEDINHNIFLQEIQHHKMDIFQLVQGKIRSICRPLLGMNKYINQDRTQ